MSRLAEELAAAAHDLDDAGVAWALVGGLAVSTWCNPRLTRDIDVAVSVDGDKDAERVIRDLLQRGYETIELVEQEAMARLATARLARNALPAILIDVLFASSCAPCTSSLESACGWSGSRYLQVDVDIYL